MNTINDVYLKLAIQKEGRLTNETLGFLWKAGFSFETSKQKLFTRCFNFPLQILFVRDDDIIDYVLSGAADIGILGQNLLYERMVKVKKLLNLKFGFCSLSLAVLKKSIFINVEDLKNCSIATSYIQSTQYFFDQNNIPIKLIKLQGSVEIAPILGVADAIVDLVSTGSTLALNDLRILTKIYDSEAVLIANGKINTKKSLLEQFIFRCKGVLTAKNYKWITMRVPTTAEGKIKKLITSLSRLSMSANSSIVQANVKEDYFWEIYKKLKEMGASQISMMPLEKFIA